MNEKTPLPIPEQFPSNPFVYSIPINPQSDILALIPLLHSIRKSDAQGRILHWYDEELLVSFECQSSPGVAREMEPHLYPPAVFFSIRRACIYFTLIPFITSLMDYWHCSREKTYMCSVLDNNNIKHVISQHFQNSYFCVIHFLSSVIIAVLF